MSGFIIGLLFGFLLKRSRLCIAGGLRDIYLEKKYTILYSVLLIIFIQSLIFFLMVHFQLLPAPQYKAFSLISVLIGSIMFGFGAILAHGCITTSLIKTGDGRLAGVMSLLSFVIFASAASQGFLSNFTKTLQGTMKINDILVPQLPFSVFFIIVPCLLAIIYLLIKDHQKRKPNFKIPYQHTGLRHLFFEKTWNIPLTAALIGILAAVGWYLSTASGRFGGFGITTPLISWLNLITTGSAKINWGSYFVVGMILGSLICTSGSQEFSFKGTDGKTLINAVLGGLLMGVGAVWAQGCIVGNGLVGTATLSLKAWYSLFFIISGLWIGAWIYYVQPMKKKEEIQ